MATAAVSNWSGNSRPLLLFQKPFFQWLLAIAINIAPNIPAAPSGVKKPSARERPPPTSPRITRLAHSTGGFKPILSCIFMVPLNPGPPNQPKSFCAPWAAIVKPATSRRIRRPRLSQIAIQMTPFLKRARDRLRVTFPSRLHMLTKYVLLEVEQAVSGFYSDSRTYSAWRRFPYPHRQAWIERWYVSLPKRAVHLVRNMELLYCIERTT